jgi:hypothetical protein
MTLDLLYDAMMMGVRCGRRQFFSKSESPYSSAAYKR